MARPTDFDRNTVIQKAQEVFWTKGYNGTSMQDLVDATQLNRSSIYNSFGSKHDLFQETLKDYAKDFDKVMKAIKAQLFKYCGNKYSTETAHRASNNFMMLCWNKH